LKYSIILRTNFTYKIPKQLVLTLSIAAILFFSILKTNGQQQDYFSNIAYITSNEGLSQSEVTSILQDKKGFLWIGTRGGLNRYDGSNIKIYLNETNNANSLANNSIEILFEDSKGTIWIGTKSNGISRYIPELDRFEQIISNFEELSEKNVISIEEGPNSNIWIGTVKNGLYIYNPKENTTQHLHETLTIADILRTKNDEMWLGTLQGAFIYNRQGAFLEHLDIGDFASLIEDEKSGLIYYVSFRDGFLSYDPILKKKIAYNISNNPDTKARQYNLHDIYQDKDRNIWISAWNGGAFRFDIKTQKLINFTLHSNQAKGSAELYNDVLCVYQDKLGTLWFGTNGGGLCKIDNRTNQFGVESFNQNGKNLPIEPIWSILKDNDDRLWVGIKGNENLYYSKNDKLFNQIKLPTFLDNKGRKVKSGIKVIYQDLNKRLWIGGNNFLSEVESTNGKFTINRINIDQKVIQIKITAMYQTSDSIFWLGTQQKGLRKSITSGNPKNQVFTSLLEHDRISAFLEDSNGQFWVGTYRGILLYQPDTNDFIRYYKNANDLETLSSNIVICLFEDSNKNIWIGTPNGLNLMIRDENNSISFKSFRVKDGLPNSYIQSILEDDHKNLWISTNKGITKLNIETKSFYNYDVEDGLQSNEFMETAAYKGTNGKLYFGSIYGLNKFHPDSIKNNSPPAVILTGLKIAGQEILSRTKYNGRSILKNAIEYGNEILLFHNENNFSIEYAALDLSSSVNSFKYQMEGLDKEWQTSTSQKSVTFSNLNSGKYIFKVKAVNDNLNIVSSETRLKIEILAPFWATWQAFVLYTFIFLGLLYLYRYIITQQSILKNNLELEKLERIKEEDLTKMKAKFFTDIAHEFRTPLSLISGPVQTLLENELNKEQRKDQLSTIQYHTKRLLSLIGQLLDFRKSESGKMTLQVAKGNFAKFTHEIFLSFKDLAESKNIEFNLKLKNESIPLTYDRGKLEIVLCNLLSNAFKYTASTIDVALSIKGLEINNSAFLAEFEHGYCEISVKDNGKGMSEDVTERIFDRFFQNSNSKAINQIGTGIGLALVKNIVELHKGNVFVKSQLNEGSEFIVQIPLGESYFSKDQFISDFKKAEDPAHYQVERTLKDFTKTTNIVDSNLPTLLIVEDNPEIQAYIRIIFQDNYTIIEAENGIIGIEKALEHLPQIIITDLMMPEMDGMTLCSELSAKEETLHIPIIMLTARTATVFKEKGYNSGADIFVTKPFNPSVLKAQVEGLLRSRKRLKDYFGKKITLLQAETDHTSADEEFLNHVMKLVEDNLTNENLNRDFLASRMAVSSSTLYRKIKGITDLDITVFVRSIRLKKAAQMILNKEDNISGIAYYVGFNDPKYFRKCFVKQFGVTPSKFGKNKPEIN
jgi:signal transduction histidine kinase/ligand-binding sensor domain-containing protein/DNA-binding response OmpR family regulator